MPPTPFHNSSEGSSHVPLGKVSIIAILLDEEGEEGTVDGAVGGSRVGKE